MIGAEGQLLDSIGVGALFANTPRGWSVIGGGYASRSGMYSIDVETFGIPPGGAVDVYIHALRYGPNRDVLARDSTLVTIYPVLLGQLPRVITARDIRLTGE